MDCGDIYKTEVCKDSQFKNHLTIYRTGTRSSLIEADYDELHEIVDTYLANQEVERRRNAAEKAMEKQTAAASYNNSNNYAFTVLPTDSKKPNHGDCHEWFYTSKCHKLKTAKGCSWNHTNVLPASERRKGKGKGNGKRDKKGKGKGDGKKGKGYGKGKGNGKGKWRWQNTLPTRRFNLAGRAEAVQTV